MAEQVPIRIVGVREGHDGQPVAIDYIAMQCTVCALVHTEADCPHDHDDDDDNPFPDVYEENYE